MLLSCLVLLRLELIDLSDAFIPKDARRDHTIRAY
jgi:hypothetical protein